MRVDGQSERPAGAAARRTYRPGVLGQRPQTPLVSAVGSRERHTEAAPLWACAAAGQPGARSPQPASALRTRRDPWPLLTPRTPGKGLRTCGGRRGVGSRAGLERAGPAIPELPFNVLLAYWMVSPLLPWRQHRSRDLGASMVCVVC